MDSLSLPLSPPSFSLYLFSLSLSLLLSLPPALSLSLSSLSLSLSLSFSLSRTHSLSLFFSLSLTLSSTLSTPVSLFHSLTHSRCDHRQTEPCTGYLPTCHWVVLRKHPSASLNPSQLPVSVIMGSTFSLFCIMLRKVEKWSLRLCTIQWCCQPSKNVYQALHASLPLIIPKN